MGVNQTRVGLEDGIPILIQPDTGERWLSTRHRWEMGISQIRVRDGYQPDMCVIGRWVSTRYGWN